MMLCYSDRTWTRRYYDDSHEGELRCEYDTQILDFIF
jgi:hypothetical protein